LTCDDTLKKIVKQLGNQQPDKSVVKKLLDEGLDVYIIDWGYPTALRRQEKLSGSLLGPGLSQKERGAEEKRMTIKLKCNNYCNSIGGS